MLKEVDRVELKLTVPEPAQLSTVHALGFDPLQAQIRQVFFFDTPEPRSARDGVLLPRHRDGLEPRVDAERPEDAADVVSDRLQAEV